MFSATVKGADAIIRRYGQIVRQRNAATKQAVLKTARAVQAYAVKSIQRGPASGRWTTATKDGKRRRASAEGQPPMSDTGNLASSIRVVSEANQMTARVGIGELARYGLYLEFGTRRNLKARPWLRPALKANKVPYRISMENAQRDKN